MNRRIYKYFLILSILVLFFGILSVYNRDSDHGDDIYIREINKLFEKVTNIKNVFDSEKKRYMGGNFVNRHFVKFMRDNLIDVRNRIDELIYGINTNSYVGINKKYLVNILKDFSKIVNSEYIVEGIFNSSDTSVMKNFEVIINDIIKVSMKYAIFKISFGIGNA